MAVVVILMVASFVRGLLSSASGTTGSTGGTGTEAPAPAPQVPGDPLSPYQNEGYTPPAPDQNPPPVPGPRNLDAAGRLVAGNPVYSEQIPVPTNCAMPRLDTNSASAAQKQAHFNQLMGCLMTVFAVPVEGAGFQMPRPPVTVYSRPIKTACGDFSEVNAAYCSGDQRIYYANSLLGSFPPAVGSAEYAAEMILAHEFGHAVQARTAILISEKYLEDAASSEAKAMEWSRRTEVQADCLAGQFVRSVAQSQQLDGADQAALTEFTRNLGDDVLSGRRGYAGGHGTGAARSAWFTQGLGSDSIGVCNSFSAPSDQVR